MFAPSKLYHFTSRMHWHFIRAEGITRGDAPTSLTTFLNHPNLTSNPEPSVQLWAKPDRIIVRKTAVRIGVTIPAEDDRLISWREFTDLHKMPRRDYRVLDASGGWEARNWWIYRGTVPPDWFAEVAFLDGGALTDSERRMVAEAKASSSYDHMEQRLGIIRIGGFTMVPTDRV